MNKDKARDVCYSLETKLKGGGWIAIQSRNTLQEILTVRDELCKAHPITRIVEVVTTIIDGVGLRDPHEETYL